MRTESTDVTAEHFIGLLEEMVDLKIQRYAETHLKLPSELGHLLAEKRETDRRRLDQIRSELVRLLIDQETCIPGDRYTGRQQ